ncbi:MAG: amidase [Woeseiaceae bacterium]
MTGVAISLPADILAADMPADITDMSASQLSAAIRQRHVSCVEVMQAYLQRIARYNPTYNAIVSMLPEDEVLAQAELADRALDNEEYWGWMHGMPHAIKNLSNAKGLENSEGSPMLAGTIADADDLHVARIRAEGAIFFGKTNTPEFGLGSQSYNPVHGTTGSAYDPSLTAGGSSGGAACGMATHMLPIADGSDMMGSLRNPGAFNNVIGFRPSQGRVPSVPSANPFFGQLSTAGPMGRNVEDTIRLLGSMAGYDSRAPLSMREALPSIEKFKAADLTGYRIGWMGNYNGYLPMEPGVLDLCETALSGLTTHGAVIEECQPEYDMARLWQTWLTFRHWELSTAKVLYDDPETRALLKPEFVWEIEGSFDMTAARLMGAAIARAEWYAALRTLFENYDILVVPTAQVFPFDASVHWPKSVAGREMDTYHRWMEVVIGGTLSGNPVVNVPVGFDERGRPMGIQCIGRMGQDKAVLEFAMAYEAATDYLDQRPNMVEPPA